MANLLFHLFRNSVDLIKPLNLQSSLWYRDKQLHFHNSNFKVNLMSSDGNWRPTIVAAYGKAAGHMMHGFLKCLPSDFTLCHGVVSMPLGSKEFCTRHTIDADKKFNYLDIFLGAYQNLPDKTSVEATECVLSMFKTYAKHEDLLFINLISGGGSALLSKPINGIDLEEKRRIILQLMHSGADIKDLNIVRSALSDVKSGKLGAHFCNTFPHGQGLSLIISDVIGNPISIIASGPTVPTSNDKVIIKDLINKYSLDDLLTPRLLCIVERTPPLSYQWENIILLSNETFVKSCCNIASLEKCHTVVLTTSYSGSVELVADQIYNTVQSIHSNLHDKKESAYNFFKDEYISLATTYDKIILIASGECEIKVKGNGLGGRNQHLALLLLSRLKLKGVIILCAGTDGEDGPTDAAGALISAETKALTKEYCLDIEGAIDNCDSYNFFKHLPESHIKCGKTGTNVSDVVIVSIDKKLII